MGVYIKGMEMPKSCCECAIKSWDGEDDVCPFSGISALSIGRQDNCPLVPAPPHGRLIDADALREDWLENGENEYVYDTNAFLDSLDDAPTIVPAEPSEEQREYEAQVEAAQYCEMYEPTYDPEMGAL